MKKRFSKRKTIAIGNRKGGVGKSSISKHIAFELAERGHCTLLIDCDSQANLTKPLFSRYLENKHNIFTLLEGTSSLEDCVMQILDNLYLIAGHHDLQFFNDEKQDKLASILDSEYLKDVEFIIIDCPPDSNNITTNNFVASDYVIAVTTSEMFSIMGIEQLTSNIELIKSEYNPSLELLGIVVNMAHLRRKLDKEYQARLRAKYGKLVFTSMVSDSADFSKALENKKTVKQAFPDSRVAEQIRFLVEEILMRINNNGGDNNNGDATLKGSETGAKESVKQGGRKRK